jgi:RNA polymerase-binding transcription factor DksA
VTSDDGRSTSVEDRALEVLATTVDVIDAVERALARLDDGSYATCATCGAPIEADRLAGDPTVERCAAHELAR